MAASSTLVRPLPMGAIACTTGRAPASWYAAHVGRSITAAIPIVVRIVRSASVPGNFVGSWEEIRNNFVRDAVGGGGSPPPNYKINLTNPQSPDGPPAAR